jgi:hypothetical protein
MYGQDLEFVFVVLMAAIAALAVIAAIEYLNKGDDDDGR